MTIAVESTDLLSQLDDVATSRLHWKIMFISGMGFFTDAYDLFIIGVVMEMLKQQWAISPLAEGLVTSTALLASALGAVIFGRVADMLGRKRIYGYEVLVLAFGALASAFSPNIWWLIFSGSFSASESEAITPSARQSWRNMRLNEPAA